MAPEQERIHELADRLEQHQPGSPEARSIVADLGGEDLDALGVEMERRARAHQAKAEKLEAELRRRKREHLEVVK